jgi:hypothetical protein
MKNKLLILICSVAVCSVSAFAQKARPKPAPKPKQMIFAVIYDGSGVEPIAVVENGKLIESAADANTTKSNPFPGLYYKPNSKYGLIFGGAPGGTVTIKSSNVGKECGGVSAEVSVQSTKTKISGFVMALASNMKLKTTASVNRRKPMPAERSEIEALVRAEFTKQNVAAASLKILRYHNLTAIDLNHDGKAELIGSYWVAPKADERALLFFIAEIGDSGKYSLNYSDYSAVKPDDVMSGDLKDLDDGVGHELLLDILDHDNDGVSEIFTIGKAFEGNNYYVYKRAASKWTKTFETYNYRCGY